MSRVVAPSATGRQGLGPRATDHSFAFDLTSGFDLDRLRAMRPPKFDAFSLTVNPHP